MSSNEENALLDGLDDPNEEERIGAALALSELASSPERVVPVLVTALERMLREDDLSDYDTEMVFCSIAAGLLPYGPSAAIALPTLIKTLQQRNWGVIGSAARILGSIGTDAAAAADPLRDVLSRLLITIAKPRKDGLSVDGLRNLSGAVRLQVADALWKIARDVPVVIPTLIDIVRQSAMYGSHAAWALAEIGPVTEAVIPALIEAGEFYALGKIGPAAAAAIPSLREGLNAENVHSRIAAATGLWQIQGDVDTLVTILVAALDDPHVFNSQTAADHLKGMGPAAVAALPALRKALANAVGEYKPAYSPARPMGQAYAEAIEAISKAPEGVGD